MFSVMSVCLCTWVPLILTITHDVIGQSEVTWDPTPWLDPDLHTFSNLFLIRGLGLVQMSAFRKAGDRPLTGRHSCSIY